MTGAGKARNVAQFVKHLPSMQEALGSIPALHKPGVIGAHLESQHLGGWRLDNQKFETSLGYRKLSGVGKWEND